MKHKKTEALIFLFKINFKKKLREDKEMLPLSLKLQKLGKAVNNLLWRVFENLEKIKGKNLYWAFYDFYFIWDLLKSKKSISRDYLNKRSH